MTCNWHTLSEGRLTQRKWEDNCDDIKRISSYASCLETISWTVRTIFFLPLRGGLAVQLVLRRWKGPGGYTESHLQGPSNLVSK
jgi:hypothetical protein